MNMIIIVKALTAIAENPELLRKYGLSGADHPTLGETPFWNDIANVKEWRLQQNVITNHVRIIDPNYFRKAWGSVEAIEKLLQHIADGSDGSALK